MIILIPYLVCVITQLIISYFLILSWSKRDYTFDWYGLNEDGMNSLLFWIIGSIFPGGIMIVLILWGAWFEFPIVQDAKHLIPGFWDRPEQWKNEFLAQFGTRLPTKEEKYQKWYKEMEEFIDSIGSR